MFSVKALHLFWKSAAWNREKRRTFRAKGAAPFFVCGGGIVGAIWRQMMSEATEKNGETAGV